MRYQSRLRSFGRERQLRSNPTPAERRLWSALRQLNTFYFRRQHRIGTLIVDFYCTDVRLAVELDGSIHLGEDAELRDRARDERLRSMGINVLHLRNDEVFRDLPGTVRRIEEVCLFL